MMRGWLLVSVGVVAGGYACSSTAGDTSASNDGGGEGGEAAGGLNAAGSLTGGVPFAGGASGETGALAVGESGQAAVAGVGGVGGEDTAGAAGQAGAPPVVAACTPNETRCAGNGVQSCDATGHWQAAVACPAITPECGGSGTCRKPQSCNGLVLECGGAGPSALQTCCASATLPGGTFNRSNDAAYPATVSAFRLDTFEVTIGRFANFVADYSQDMISAGAGKNPNDAGDTGWDSAWNAKLPATVAALKTAVQCDAKYQTWGANLNTLPMNCLSWYVAEAFCIWDGGRLPTEAELSYAAVGGDQQRYYPWGATQPNAVNFEANYGCDPQAETCIGDLRLQYAGYNHNGLGRWGQADLAGNVWEWAVDFYADPYAQVECVDCANLVGSKSKAIRGGAFNTSTTTLVNAHRDAAFLSAAPTAAMGVRCARQL